jgi:hypothetical protein
MVSLIIAVMMWCWDPVESASGYRIYWSVSPVEWSEFVEVTAEQAGCAGTEEECCDQGWTPVEALPNQIVYYIVTAYNEAGEGPTGHEPPPAPENVTRVLEVP